MKQKHSKGPDGELRAPPTSGRGRGRPRKNPYQRIDPKTDDYFNAPERKGGPVDPLKWFREHHEQLLKESYPTLEEYPLYQELLQFSEMTSDGSANPQNGADSQNQALENGAPANGNPEGSNTEEINQPNSPE